MSTSTLDKIRDAIRAHETRDLEARRARLERERLAADERIKRRRKYAGTDEQDASARELWT